MPVVSQDLPRRIILEEAFGENTCLSLHYSRLKKKRGDFAFKKNFCWYFKWALQYLNLSYNIRCLKVVLCQVSRALIIDSIDIIHTCKTTWTPYVNLKGSGRLLCAKRGCGQMLVSYDALCRHCADEHDFVLNYESLRFDNSDHFKVTLITLLVHTSIADCLSVRIFEMSIGSFFENESGNPFVQKIGSKEGVPVPLKRVLNQETRSSLTPICKELMYEHKQFLCFFCSTIRSCFFLLFWRP